MSDEQTPAATPEPTPAVVVPEEHRPAVDKLTQLRDELKLKAHLAGAELHSHWEELEKKWTLLQSRLVPVKQAGAETGHEVHGALTNLLHELGEGYDRFKAAIHKV